jgi:hypothetical protein
LDGNRLVFVVVMDDKNKIAILLMEKVHRYLPKDMMILFTTDKLMLDFNNKFCSDDLPVTLAQVNYYKLCEKSSPPCWKSPRSIQQIEGLMTEFFEDGIVCRIKSGGMRDYYKLNSDAISIAKLKVISHS